MKTLPKVASEMALHVLAYNLTRVMNIMGIPAARHGSDEGITKLTQRLSPRSRRLDTSDKSVSTQPRPEGDIGHQDLL